MVKLSVDLNEPKDSSKTDKAAQNVVIIACHTPKSLTLEIHHGGWFTPTPSRSYIGGHLSSVNVVDIDEFCLHNLKDMVVKLGYGVEDLMYCHFLIPSLGLDYGLHSLNVDADVLEMSKYVKDYKIILVYVEHRSSIVDTSMFDSSPDVNRNVRKEWENVSSNSSSIGEVMKKLSKEQPTSSVARPIVVENGVDPFDGLDEILGTSSTADDFSFGKFKEVEVEANTESKEEERDTKGNDTSGSDSEDLDYDPNHDDVYDDDEHIVKEVHVNMNNFSFTADPKHDKSIGVVDVQEDDLDVIDYDLFGSDLDGEIDSQRRIQLRELRRIGKKKNKGPNKYYFYLGQQFSSKEIVKRRVKKHSVETRRQLILIKNNNERVRVRCEGTIPALVPYVAIDNNMDKNLFSQTKGGPAIRENINSDKQNILSKDKTVKGEGKKVITPKKVDKYSCPWTMLVTYTKECRWEMGNHVIKSLATNPDILMRSVQDQMQKQFEVGVSKMKAFRAKRIAYDIITDSLQSRIEAESKASWCWFLNLLGEDLGIEANFNYTFISDRQKVNSRKKIGELKSFNSDAYDWLMKIPLEQWSRARFFMAEPNGVHLVQKVIAKTVGPLTPSVTKIFDGIKKPTQYNVQWNGGFLYEVTGPYKDQYVVNMDRRWVLVYLNNGFMLLTDLKHRNMYTHSRPPKKRKKSNDEIASQSASSGKLSRKGKSASCGKYGNVGHNRKGYRGQGGGSNQAGARKVSGQAVGSRKVSG
ncbi:mutator type transposase [Tanacetum coccineum]